MYTVLNVIETILHHWKRCTSKIKYENTKMVMLKNQNEVHLTLQGFIVTAQKKKKIAVIICNHILTSPH